MNAIWAMGAVASVFQRGDRRPVVGKDGVATAVAPAFDQALAADDDVAHGVAVASEHHRIELAHAVREALRVSRRVVIIDYARPALMPAFLWRHVINRFGYAVFGSRDIDFEAMERLAGRCQVSELYGGLYRLMMLEGVADAGS